MEKKIKYFKYPNTIQNNREKQKKINRKRKYMNIFFFIKRLQFK